MNFTEIGLRPDKSEEIISTAKSLEYSTIGLNTKPDSADLDVVRRLDLDPRNPNELLRSLRSNRWKNEIITVNCRTKSVARQAGRDHRVDLITYPVLGNWRENSLDRQQAGLMRNSGCGYLIDVSHLLENDRKILRKNIVFLKKNTENALKRGIPVVASTCADKVWGLRDPYGVASLLSLLDVDEDHALEMVSSIPNDLVDRNRGKLKPSYIASGVQLIEDE